MTASWMNGPVPEQDAVIARLRESNAILREELQQATLKPYRSFLRGMVVGGFIVAALIASLPAYSQGFYTCTPPDRITIVDDGPGRAIVTFYNSVNDCYNNIDRVMETDGGIAVRVIIKVGSADNEYRETIILEPQDPMMMAFPPEGDLYDGEERRFVIQGGLS